MARRTVTQAPYESGYLITPSDTVNLYPCPDAIYCGTTGTVSYVDCGGATVATTFVAGKTYPASVRRVNSTGTTAAGLVAMMAAGNTLRAPAPSLGLNSLSGALDPSITFTRGSTATYRDSTGTRQTAAINAPRFDNTAAGVPLGLLIEESRQNVFLNSGAPGTQTVTLTVGSWTVWMEGTGSVTSSAGTATATGYGAAVNGTPNVLNVTVGGTVILTVAGGPTLAQCENGAFATSYIPTTGSPVTRSADNAVISTLTPWFNASAGTMYAESDALVTSGTNFVWTFSDNSISNRINIYTAATAAMEMNTAGVSQASISTGVPMTANVPFRTAAAWALNDVAATGGGLTPTLDASATIPTVDRLYLGGHWTGALPLNGHLRRLNYWPSRLPDVLLRSITA